jgi:hypothetical protein
MRSTKSIMSVAQVVVDNPEEVTAGLIGLLDAYDVSAEDLGDYEVTPFGTNKFLITIVFLDNNVYFNASAALGIITGLQKALILARSIIPLIGLKVAAVKVLLRIRRKQNTPIALTFLKFKKAISKAARVNSLGLKYLSLRINFSLKNKQNLLFGIKSKQFEALWNGVPVEE